MIDLKEADARNVSEGNPSRYYESFATPMRDFSPEVARRIEYFEASYQHEAPEDGEPASILQRAVIEAGLPAAGQLSSGRSGEFVSSMPDGSEVSVLQDGNHITRAINMDGVEYSLATPVESADFSGALGDYETVQQIEGSKLKKTRAALSFLENPRFAETPFEDMKQSLLHILGHELFNELGLRDQTDKAQVIQTLQTNAGRYQQKLDEAKRSFQIKAKEAVARTRERYRENDERMKTALRALKYSGLGRLGVEYLVSQITGNVVIPQL